MCKNGWFLLNRSHNRDIYVHKGVPSTVTVFTWLIAALPMAAIFEQMKAYNKEEATDK